MLADPRPVGAGLAPGVGQLNAGDRALGGDEASDALQRFDLFVVPQAKVFGGDTPVGGNRRGFGENQTGTAHRAAAQVHQVPVVGQAVDAGVLAHRRHGDAVGQGQLAKSKGFKQQTHGAPLESVGRLQGSV